jgi:ATP-binding cassette subfamily B protein
LLVQGLLPAATVYLIRLLVDSLVVSIDTGGSWTSFRLTAILGALMAAIMLLTELMQSATQWVRITQAELIRDYLSSLIHAKAVAVDLAFYESSEYHDRLDRAHTDLNARPAALLDSGGNLLQNSITLVAIGVLLVPYDVWLPIVLLASLLPTVCILLHYNRRFHRWWEHTTPDRRRVQYYDMLLTHSAFAAELRLFNLGPHFQSVYQSLRQRLRLERLQLTLDQSLAQVAASAVGVLMACGALGWMVWRAFHGWLTLGDLALFYQAFTRGQSILRSLLENAGQIYANSLFLGNLFEFLDLQPRIVDPPQPTPAPVVLHNDLCFQDVTFSYPGSQRAVLQHFNLTISAGQIVALVGANGAGKSTLLKLLCRFYDPQAGRLTLDGIDIRHLPLQELRRLITVLFQWPIPYQATAAQNIAFGDVYREPSADELASAACSAGAHEIITRLPQGYNTTLGRWFADGLELSVGEWQRLALARAFLRRAQIIVLDEPTSALDSWAEAAWFDRFRLLAHGRTAIVITHRFSIAKCADIIHVVDAGQIIESGTHHELLAKNGLYAQSWCAQTEGSPHLVRSPIPSNGASGMPDFGDAAARP